MIALLSRSQMKEVILIITGGSAILLRELGFRSPLNPRGNDPGPEREEWPTSYVWHSLIFRSITDRQTG